MEHDRQRSEIYGGFEQGPIRPPSEANSLLIRVTRNCPWNRCTFCPVYKETAFSIRPVAHVKRDIDTVHRYVKRLRPLIKHSGRLRRAQIYDAGKDVASSDLQAYHAAVNWLAGGMKSIFIQDANSLIIKPADFISILSHLTKRFSWVERITSYGRSHTIARLTEEELKAMKNAGLNRIHIGLESGSDQVLKRVMKGVSKAVHITAGQKVKNTGIELSEYVMPGLGGSDLSSVHALETADALNQINPDFIRLRTLAIPAGVPLDEEYKGGHFKKCSDLMIVREILTFIESLNNITSKIKSDHFLNLFQELEGRLPEDKAYMVNLLNEFLSLDSHDQLIFRVGRKLGVFSRLSDLQSQRRRTRAEKVCQELEATSENADDVIEQLMAGHL